MFDAKLKHNLFGLLPYQIHRSMRLAALCAIAVVIAFPALPVQIPTVIGQMFHRFFALTGPAQPHTMSSVLVVFHFYMGSSD